VCATRWSEELDSSEAIAVETFLADFGLRRINGFAFPWPDLGIDPGTAGEVGGDTLTVTSAGAAVFPYLDGDIPVDDFTYGYYGSGILPGFETLVAGPGGPHRCSACSRIQ